MPSSSAGKYHGFGISQRYLDPEVQSVRMRKDLAQVPAERLEPPEPFVGVTADGSVVPGLFALGNTGVPTTALREAAEDFIAALAEAQRARALEAVDSPGWQMWHNGLELPRGASMRTMTQLQRDAALAVIRASMSARGFDTARNAMKLNAALGELVGDPAIFNEWQYGFSIFGNPSRAHADQPWGWQLQGHHLVLHCFVLRDQIVMSPAFVGAEPSRADSGTYAGIAILQAEERSGLDLMQALRPAQQATAVLFRSLLPGDLPPGRWAPGDQRHRSGANKDNLVLPYEGIRADELSAGQQDLLLRLIEVYVGRMRPGHAEVRMDEVRRHLGGTYFAWMGAWDDSSVFYYKVHSPVILIEFDHHSGVVLDNERPEKFHVHTIVRTPNGNDYGKDLLRQHYARFHAAAV